LALLICIKAPEAYPWNSSLELLTCLQIAQAVKTLPKD